MCLKILTKFYRDGRRKMEKKGIIAISHKGLIYKRLNIKQYYKKEKFRLIIYKIQWQHKGIKDKQIMLYYKYNLHN